MIQSNFPDNQINLVGNLAADPEPHEGFFTFTLYKNNNYIDKTTNEEVRRESDKLDVIVFQSMGKAYDLASRLKARDFVRVRSEPTTNTVDEGEKNRKYTSFKAFDVELLKANEPKD